MEIKLTPPLEKIVTRLIESGKFEWPHQVIGEALLRLDEQEIDPDIRHAAFNAEMQLRLESLDRGEAVDPDEVFARLRKRSADRGRAAA